MPQHIDRRKQPQNAIKAIGLAIKEMRWAIKEITNQKFTSPKGEWTNESFGFTIKMPKNMDYIRKFWIGYLNHKKITTPGIYAGIDPVPLGEGFTPLKHGYRESPFDGFIILKQVIPQKEIERLENDYGKTELKKKVKEILLKTYPFSIK